MENITTHDQEIFESKVLYAMQLIEKRFKYSEVKQFVMDDGASEADTKLIMAEAVKKINAFKKGKGKEYIIAGAVLIVLGITTTILSYFLAWLNHLHIYYLYYGAIIGGVSLIVRGLKIIK